jgi:hypothetical protein
MRQFVRRIGALVIAVSASALLGVAIDHAPALAAREADSADIIAQFGLAPSGWRMYNLNATDYYDPLEGPKPVTNDPAYPHVGNLQEGQKTHRVADLSNPILQPWVREQMQPTNDEVLAGKTPFVATSLCWPNGVPAQLLVPNRIFFLQKPDEITMMFERDHHVRRIRLNQEHSENPAPSWFGESIGHYEGGDTLVIDTIGLSDHPLSFVDNFRTPHSEQLHVIERWKIVDEGQLIEVDFTVYDPGAFTMPWSGRMSYRRDARGPMVEFICAENNRDPWDLDAYSMPQDMTPDF